MCSRIKTVDGSGGRRAHKTRSRDKKEMLMGLYGTYLEDETCVDSQTQLVEYRCLYGILKQKSGDSDDHRGCTVSARWSLEVVKVKWSGLRKRINVIVLCPDVFPRGERMPSWCST